MPAFQPSLPSASRRHRVPLALPYRPYRFHPTRRRRIPSAKLPDVVVIGAGPAGLSTAHELALRGASVQVLATHTRRPAGLAAAGMLAPASELLTGPLAALCEASLALFPAFVRRLEGASGLDLRYVARGDFLEPVMRGELGEGALSGEQARLVEPALSERVKGARRHRGDAHVDNRALMRALRVACETSGVIVRDDVFVRRIALRNEGEVEGVVLEGNEMVGAGHFILAAGAWSGGLLPGLPVRPVKGQMLSLRALGNEADAARLNHVLYGEDCYVVPKMDGEEFFVGATVEEGTFSVHNTAGGVAKLLNAAVELVPAFAKYEVKETWSGLRPATPDLAPILGMSEFSNLSMATGYYRNGILLTPASAKIAAATALGDRDTLSPDLRNLTENFSYKRFLNNKAPVRYGGNASAPSLEKPQQKELAETKASEEEEVYPPEIKLWRILPNGKRQPVPPAKRTSNATDSAFSSTKRASTTPTSLPANPPGTTGASGSRAEESFVYQKDVSSPENVSGENDAYEDVMRYRNRADKSMSEAMAENRAFGRTKSSLEGAEMPLSFSEEEVAVYDKAMEQGMQDMQDALRTFDASHPSVIATNAEKSAPHVQTSSKPSGYSVPSMNGEPKIGDDTSTSGYF